MLNGLNIDQWVMARDRYRLNRLRKDKKPILQRLKNYLNSLMLKLDSVLNAYQNQIKSGPSCNPIC